MKLRNMKELIVVAVAFAALAAYIIPWPGIDTAQAKDKPDKDKCKPKKSYGCSDECKKKCDENVGISISNQQQEDQQDQTQQDHKSKKEDNNKPQQDEQGTGLHKHRSD
jgi:hypothetical protein